MMLERSKAGGEWATEDEMDGITNSKDMSLSKLRNIVKDKEVWQATVHGVTRVRHDLATKPPPSLA